MSQPSTEEHQREFLEAVTAGNRGKAEKLWGSCPAPQQFTVRRNPLCEAIRTEQEDMALWLIELGFDHTGQDLRGTPAVALCVIADQPRVLKRLLERGESLHRRVSGHLTSLMPGPPLYNKLTHVKDFPKNDKFEIFHEGNLLHVAAVAGSDRCARLLLEAGINPEERDSEGRTPAMLAKLGGKSTQRVLELLPRSAATSDFGRDEWFTLALLREDTDGVLEAIASGVDISQKIESKYSSTATPLIVAACQGNLGVVRALIDAGADVDQVDSPLGKKRSLRDLKALLEQAGFDALTSMPLESGRTALGWAALFGHVDTIKLLISAGADVNAVDLFHFTALHLAVIGDHSEAVECLIKSGLDPNAEAFDNTTPLHVAAASNAAKSPSVLLAAGADPTRVNREGETAYVVAKRYGNRAISKKLEALLPEELGTNKAKKKQPEWQWKKVAFEAVLREVKALHGKAAQSLTTDIRIKRMDAMRSEAFLKVVETLRRKLKAKDAGQLSELFPIISMEVRAISDDKLLKLQDEFVNQGVFVVRELVVKNETCRIYVVPTVELPEVFALFGTNGNNLGLTPELTIAWLMRLYDRYPFRLIGIAQDGAELRFVDLIREPNELAHELMTVCPPPINATKSLQELCDTLRSRRPQVFLWWD